MRSKLLVLVSFLMIGVLALAACQTSTQPTTVGEQPDADLPQIGVTIYKYDDNFMSFVRRNIQRNAEGKAILSMNDSQNDQAKQNDQVDTMISKGVSALAINLVDPQAASAIIAKAQAAGLPVIFFNKEPSAADLNSYEKAWYVGTTSAESGVMEGQIIVDSWNANPDWDKNGDGIIQYVLLKGEPGHPDAEARTTFAIQTVNEAGIQTEELANKSDCGDLMRVGLCLDWHWKQRSSVFFHRSSSPPGSSVMETLSTVSPGTMTITRRFSPNR